MNESNHWQEFRSTKSNPWNLKQAAHLYRRGGFGATLEQLESAVKRGLSETVDLLFADPSTDSESSFRILEKQIRTGSSLERMPTYWLYRMVKSDAQLLEKTTLFWHGHFATSAEKVDEVSLMLDQNDLLRKNALGKFLPLVQGISKDPAMLIYLDSKVNRKTRPNENYARELMELFCLGVGNYTEDDIKQVARTFTGWEVRNDKFRFNKYQHDYGVKKFLGSTGEFDGEQAVKIVLGQKSSTKFIARKLINFFVTDMPVSDSVVDELADKLRQSDFHVGQAVRTIFKSQLFHESVGKKIRSPVELAIGFLRCFDGSANFVQLSQRLRELGQLPFYPPNVKGWPGGRTWINSATLLGRINLISELLRDGKTRFGGKGLDEWTDPLLQLSGDKITDQLETLLLAEPIPSQAKQQIVDILDNPKGSKLERWKKAMIAIASLPEFQLA